MGVSSIYYDILFKRVVVVVVVRHVHKRYNPLSQQSNVKNEQAETCDEYHCVGVCMHLFLSFFLFAYHILSSSHTCHAYIHTYKQTNIHTRIYIHFYTKHKALFVSGMRVFERDEPRRQQGHTRNKVYIAYHNTTRRTEREEEGGGGGGGEGQDINTRIGYINIYINTIQSQITE